jgi:hypothetical protein
MLLIKRTEISRILHKNKVRFVVNYDISKCKFMFAMEMFSLCHIKRRCEIFLAHTTMSHRTQIFCPVFEWLGVEFVKFYICQHKICSECSVFVSPECVNVDDICSGVAGQGNLSHYIFRKTLSKQCCQHSYFPPLRNSHFLIYAKSSFTTVTCITNLMVCSRSKY